MKLKITVHGVAYEVEVDVLDAGEDLLPAGPLPTVRAGAAAPPAAPSGGASSAAAPSSSRPEPTAPGLPTSAGDESTIVSPIAGTVLEVKCAVGEAVEAQAVLLVIEAMKMKTTICAPAAGSVKTIHVAAGDAVRENQTLLELA